MNFPINFDKDSGEEIAEGFIRWVMGNDRNARLNAERKQQLAEIFDALLEKYQGAKEKARDLQEELNDLHEAIVNDAVDLTDTRNERDRLKGQLRALQQAAGATGLEGT